MAIGKYRFAGIAVRAFFKTLQGVTKMAVLITKMQCMYRYMIVGSAEIAICVPLRGILKQAPGLPFRFTACLFIIFTIAALSGKIDALAQGAVKSSHGAWTIVCQTFPGAASEQCALMQNVVAEDRSEVGLSVVALKTADGKARLLRILAPLGVLLPNGLGLNVDGNNIGRASFTRCFQDGCYAEVILEDALLSTLKSGKKATFIIFQTPEEGIGIPVNLEGFTEGYDKLP